MANMNMIQALNSAMDIMLGRDPSVVLMGEDIGYFGGVFRATEGLQRKYGEHRVIDTPIAEGGIVAAAIGMSVNGLRPVAEIQFADYIYPGFDQITSELARIRYRSAGEFYAPVTIRTPCGGGIRGGQTHSQSPEGIFTHVSGLKVVMPSNPYDAKGLLITSIEDDDPVIFFEPKRLYNGPFDGDPNKPAVPWSSHPKGQVDEGHYTVPLGKADVVRSGADVTVITYGTMVFVALAAAAALGLDAEVIDLRSLVPLDVDTICSSVRKTGRCVVAHEATRFSGFGAEILSIIQEECFWDLEAPIQRVAGWDTPYPHAFEWEYFPGQARVGAALKAAMGGCMSQFVFKMPDLGEGTVDAEIVLWRTKPGDVVEEDQVIVEVMTDKAAVEVPAPVSGRVVSITGEPGDKVAVGSPLIIFETASDGASGGASATAVAAPAANAPVEREGKSVPAPAAAASKATAPAPAAAVPAADPGVHGGRVMTSPANRRRAREAGIDLHTISGSGPGGRIVTRDVVAATGQTASRQSATGDAAMGQGAGRPTPLGSGSGGAGKALVAPRGETSEIKVIGVRRVIAERMSEAKRTIPHFAYVEEVDVTELESLRVHLNAKQPQGEPGLTYLPLVIMALTRALESFPQCNVLYDSARGVLVRYRPIHVGIATQTPDGLKVPVVRNAQALSLGDLAAAIRTVSERARTNKATREELTGSTITVTSLGKLGGIASTPVINSPEVAIIGLNKAVDRPMVHNGTVAVRRIMNLSSSFDHRFVDGYDAAAMIQALKDLLEHPAMIFIPKV